MNILETLLGSKLEELVKREIATIMPEIKELIRQEIVVMLPDLQKQIDNSIEVVVSEVVKKIIEEMTPTPNPTIVPTPNS